MDKSIITAVIILLFYSGCADNLGLLANSSYKMIIIRDTAPNFDVKIKDFEGKYVVLALTDEFPNLNQFEMSTIIKSQYSIGKVEGGIINLRISTSSLDYWNGIESKWVAFFISNGRGDDVKQGYLSKENHDFKEPITYLSNNDFMLPFDISNNNIASMFPF